MSSSITRATLVKFTTFGDLLRFLRRYKGLTQLELSFKVGYSHAQISRLEQNLRLPDIPTIEARFVPALGLKDESIAIERLLELAANVRREDAPSPGLCPYKGLNYFDEPDADFFVGREALTAQLVERVHGLASNGESDQERFLAIVGASGSGKSSLARAGLVPALHWNQASADWDIRVFTPTAHPLESLAACLTQEAESVSATATLMDDLGRDSRSLQLFAKRKQHTDNSHLLLVVDQFEELFALCRSEEERVSFIANLLSAAFQPEGPAIIVITLWADFYAHCANYDQLRAALARNQEYIGAMGAEELRRAIEEPAIRGRWEFEPGLIDLLLHDVGADAGHTPEPGALPLLSHALLETWQRRRGRTMTLSGYASSGGVRGAIAETAEAVFSDQFTGQQRSIARRIFLRLTELGDEAAATDTRRRATFKELILRPEDAAMTHVVLKALADARLIITSQDSAEVAHEALIREWPTLRNWLEENREGLRLHRHLTEAAEAWQAMGRDPGELYRGARLAQAVEWISRPENADALNTQERAFLETSRKLEVQETTEREAQRQRELEAAQRAAEEQARSTARLRRRALYLVGALLLALVMAGAAAAFASWNSTLAVQNAKSAMFASTQQAIAEAEADKRATQQALAENEAQARATAEANALHERDLTQAQRLAAEANSLMLNNGETNLIALLSIRSIIKQYTPSGDVMLTSLTNLEAPPREFRGHLADIYGVAFSPDGKYLATGSNDMTARLWDLATGETVQVFSGHSGEVGEVAFSPDGKYLLTGATDQTARLWDVASGKTVQIFSGSTGGGGSVAFSPDGKYLVSDDGSNARIWDVATGQTLHVLTGHSGLIPRVAFSPDGKYVLTGGTDQTARIWDAATGSEVKVIRMPSYTESVAISPDSKYVAIGNSDGVARLWEIATGGMVHEFTGHQGFVQGIRFSPDGRFLLTGSASGTAKLWDLATSQTIHVFGGHGSGVQGVTFSPDGKLVATVSNDGIARVWNWQTSLSGMQFAGHGGAVYQATFSPDGKQVVTASLDGTARIWDAATGQTVITLAGHTDEVRDALFSPDGKTVLTTSGDDTARLWDAASGEELRRFEGHTDLVNRAAFSPDGKYVVTTSFDGTARVWDAQTAQKILAYTNQGPGHVNRIAFSPDGKTVVTSGDDGTARIWDPLTGEELMVFEGHTGFVAGVAFSPDGLKVVTASGASGALLWDIASGQQVRAFKGHQGDVLGVAFSPDGSFLATGSADGTARLWDLQTGQELRRFTGHTGGLRNIVFSPDGEFILTASEDNTARLWLIDLDDTIQAVCAMLTRDLTPEERLQFGITDERPTCPSQ